MTVAAATAIHAPSVSYHALAPILIMLGVALAGVLVEGLVPRA
jgi:NADH-quinone oxidoreductase subunit N